MELYTGEYYALNETFTYEHSYESTGLTGHALFQCIVLLIETIIYIFFTSAIVSDRQRYQTTFWITLLNFSVTYILLGIIRYFGEVHIVVFPETNKSICHVVHFLNGSIGDGSEMAIVVICLDLIVQNMMSERYEKRKYRNCILILILVTWLLIIIKEIIFRKQSIIEFYCYQSNPMWVVWTEIAFIFLRTTMTLVAVGFLLFIAKTSSEPMSQLIGLLGAPIVIGIILCLVNILTVTYQMVAMDSYHDVRNFGWVSSLLRLFSPIIVALVWLLDNKFRESVKKLLNCLRCRKMGPQPTEHELTTDIA